MKNTKKQLLSLGVFAALSLSASAATTLVGPALLNGDFQDLTIATKTNYTAGEATWLAFGPNINSGGAVQIDTAGAANFAVVGITGANAQYFIAQSTGHTIALGDTFSGSYDWRTDINMTGTESAQMYLFYTADDTMGGTATEIANWDSGNTFSGAFATVNGTPTTGADALAEGRTLFVGVRLNADASSWTRIDNVNLSATAVPEPSSSALLGLGGLALILRRRK